MKHLDSLLSLTIPGIDGTPTKFTAPENIPSGENLTISGLASTFISLFLVVGVLLSLIYLVYGGWFWLQSKGDKQQLDKARRIIIYSIVGLIVMALALLIVNTVSTLLGVEAPTG